MKIISAADLQNLPNLRSLNLSDNYIMQLKSETFQYNELLQALHLNGNPMYEIQNGTFTSLQNLRVLYLQTNNIRQISNGTFNGLENLFFLRFSTLGHGGAKIGAFRNLTSLKTIDLSVNEISVLTNKSFLGLPSLRFLGLTLNRINHISSGTFRHNPYLRYIRLNFNRLTFISSALCDGPYNMYHLDLSNNNLEEFGIEALLNCAHSLEILNMRRTHIARILPANKPMMAIQQVYLGVNYLVNLTINSLSVFANASRISLYMANINDNSAAALTKLKKIQDLRLDFNHISKDFNFSANQNLLKLNLSHQNLESLSDEKFKGLVKLRTLDVTSNYVSFISKSIFTNFPSLVEVSLVANRLRAIYRDTFQGNNSCRILHLASNTIAEIHEDSFSEMSYLEEL
ncbi:Leucine-rich repeat-containing G-protein coupled receptor 5 [Trichoplax sp. H2]|nr:Leucine-rich repeat-containing G-protein coupled receptor 5 [Trichoplax sp. H2]|eukprot:RDD45090.1 Leucine-rich repeat-containing G-protein coupled receptor 5 [Trichoplax sp. H2]